MNKNNSLTELPSMDFEFFFEGTGVITKQGYKGEFSYKMPNTKVQCLIDKHFAYLNGDLAIQLDSSTLKIHRKIAYLRYTLTEFPKFWKEKDLGYELMDHNIIDEVYDKVIDFENDWMKEVWGDELNEDKDEEGSEKG